MTSKHIAASLAAIIMAGAAFGNYPVCRQKADAKTPSVKSFADSVMPLLQDDPDAQFATLCYNQKQHRLLRDGKAVREDAVPGFRVIDGELRIAASETVRSGETADQEYLPLEEAAPLIGLETVETDEGVFVSDPFRSGTLIVKSESLSDTKGATEIGVGWNDLHVLQYPTAADAYAAYQDYLKDDSVIFAEPNRTYHIDDAEAPESSGYDFPADNWGWEAVGAGDFLTQYEESAASAPEVVVAVIDTGIYSEHNWFQGRIAEGGAGFISENDATYEDGNGHGTHCAGIICGMTPENVKILPLKAMSDNGSGRALELYCAMVYAAEHNVDVVSMSFGGFGSSPMFEEACRLLREKDIPCVAAAGNDVMDAKYFSPANIPDVITVSSVSNVVNRYYFDLGYEDTRTPGEMANAEYWLSPFSNLGEGIDFAAPGDDIQSAFIGSPDSTYSLNGTSMACPHVAACVADILTVRNDYSIREIYDCLKSNAYDLGDPGFDKKYGWGMVNIADPDFNISELQQPEASVESGKYSKEFTVTLSTQEPDAEIRYTTDGTYPDIDTGILYQGEAIVIDSETELYAVTVKDGKRSARAHWHYAFSINAPILSPKPGNYDEPVEVELPQSVADRAYYTLDGSDPDPENGTKYTGPIKINETTLLKIVITAGRYVSEPFGYYYAINGQTSKLMFDVQDGVLVKYYGFEAEVDLNDYFAPGELTRIGDEAFESNKKLKHIILPDSVVSIGAFAFSNCERLNAVTARGVETVEDFAFTGDRKISQFEMPALKTVGIGGFYCAFADGTDAFGEDNQIRAIGGSAFEGSGLSKAVFPNLEELGNSAFASCAFLEKAALPAHITVLPYATFYLCSSLNSLDAPGVTELEDAALSIQEDIFIDPLAPKILEECTIDFSRLTSIGSYALPSLNDVKESVSFDSLTQIRANAFFAYNVEELHLPALKVIPEDAFDCAECRYVYLDSAEQFGDFALCPDDAEYPITFIFGDHVKSVNKNPLDSRYNRNTIAAPADSPMIRYAQAARYPYYIIPDILVPSDFCARIQYENVCLNECIALAVRSRIEFTALDAEYDPFYTAPEQPLYQDENGKVFLDTSVPGTVTVRADAVDDTDTVLTSKTLEFTIEPVDSAEVVTKEGAVLIDWRNAKFRTTDKEDKYGEYEEAYGSYSFRFIPEEDGEYRFVPANGEETVTVFNAQNEQIGFTPEWDFYGDQLIDPVEMKAGETYRIVAECQNKSLRILPTFYTSINITRKQTTMALGTVTTKRIYEGGLPDDVPAVTVTNDMETCTLLQDVDYRVIYQKDGNSGTLFILGIGECRGLEVRDLMGCDGDYTLGETLSLPELQNGESVCYHVQRDADKGLSWFYLDAVDAYMQDFLRCVEAPFRSKCISIELFDSEMFSLSEGVYSGDSEYSTGIAEWIINQEEIVTDDFYFVIQNKNDLVFPDGTLLLKSKEINNDFDFSRCDIDYYMGLPYTGKKLKLVDAVRKADGTLLEEGKDYEVFTSNDSIPGDTVILVRGIGDYYGSQAELSYIDEPSAFAGSAALTPISLNEPFSLSQYAACYGLKTDSNYQCVLRKTAGSDPDTPYIYSVYTYNSVQRMWEEVCFGSGREAEKVLELMPGTYHIYITQYGQGAEFVMDTMQETLTGIGRAEVQSRLLYYTGELLQPEITLTYEGRQLTENEDYVILPAEKPIREPGIYTLTAAGIGSFGGECSICVIVRKDDETENQEVKNGSNALEITTPGQTISAVWRPEQEHYGISMNTLYPVSLAIYDSETNQEVSVLDGNGYLCDFFDVTPGKEYLIYSSWVGPQVTDAICFTLLSDYIDLTECTAEFQNQIMFTGQGQTPEFTVRNGETVLQKDRDYVVYYSGGNCEPGHAVISLIGTGNCMGELTLHYFLYPDTDAAAFEADEEKKDLKQDEVLETFALLPGEIQRYEFKAPKDGIYAVDRPDPEAAGVCVFVFGPDMEIIPLETDQIPLRKGEILRFLAIAEHIDGYVKYEVGYSLAVHMAKPGHELRIGDSVYLIQDGTAYLDQYEGDNIGIQLPETVYDPELDEEIPVGGYTQDLLTALCSSRTFYCEPDSEAYQFLQKAGVCFAVPDPQSGVKGDITGDGIVNINDWLTLMRWLNENPGMLMSESAFAVSDYNEDGCLDLLDANAIMEIASAEQG